LQLKVASPNVRTKVLISSTGLSSERLFYFQKQNISIVDTNLQKQNT